MKNKIYCLPGTMCDQRLWQACIKHLPENVELIHLAIPMGKSIDEIITALDKLLPKGKVNLAGFSLGGYLASAYALKYPEKVSKLLLISNMSYSLPEAELKERSRTIAYLKTHGYSGIPTKRITALLHPDNRNNQDIIHCIREMDTSLGKATLIYQLTVTTQRENLLIKLPKLSFPVQFLIGDNDSLVKLSRISNILGQSEHVSLIVLSNTGHMLPLEQPQKCALKMNNFFIE
ncbi:MAG: alpha/beta hydrolase [Colwellia sp.]|nr:alpha/beta hydrolase [Colwellia sp.]